MNRHSWIYIQRLLKDRYNAPWSHWIIFQTKFSGISCRRKTDEILNIWTNNWEKHCATRIYCPKKPYMCTRFKWQIMEKHPWLKNNLELSINTFFITHNYTLFILRSINQQLYTLIKHSSSYILAFDFVLAISKLTYSFDLRSWT